MSHTPEHIRAIRELESQAADIELELQREIDLLRERARAKRDPLLSKRATILKNIPGFWLAVLKRNEDLMASYCAVTAQDEDALQHLVDICCSKENADGFRLEFVFAKNPFFTNEVLAKEYHFAAGTEGDSTRYLDHTTVAQPIAWIAGKDLTKRQVKRTVVARRTGIAREVDDTELVPSFFTFFEPIDEGPQDITEDNEEEADAREEALQLDFAVGELFKDTIIPRAGKIYAPDAADSAKPSPDIPAAATSKPAAHVSEW